MVSPIVFDFLNDLSNNNNREWFHAHKDYYNEAKAAYEATALRFIAMINEVDGDVGFMELRDCTYRIYRDTRFSLDKTPYKNHMGIYVVRGGKKSPMAGYYLHFENNNCFAHGGIYMPQPKVLNAVREHIFHRIDDFKAIIETPEFKSTFGSIEGDKLKTVPKGFDKNFADIDLLRFKSYSLTYSFPNNEVLADGFDQRLKSVYAKMTPFVKFLNDVIIDLV